MGINPNLIRAEIAAKASAAEAERIILAGEQKIAEAETAQQVETASTLNNIMQETINPGISRFQNNQKDLKDTGIRISKAKQEKLERRFIPPEQVKEQAEQFERRNPELKAAVLKQLLEEAGNCKNKDELLTLLNKYYNNDPFLVDQALDFLLATTLEDLHKIVVEAKQTHVTLFQKEIAAGTNIDKEVKQYATLGLGSHQSLRSLYKDITNNPREAIPLFLELSGRFGYKDLRKVFAFIFHSLGADLKSGGSFIPPGQLHRLISVTRDLQAGLGAIKFFQARMRIIQSLFQREGLSLPPSVTFEQISKIFLNYLQERYPNAEKVLQMPTKLGLTSDILAKIIVLSQMRDGVREVSIDRFFRSLEHRNEVFNSILDALEQLEDEYDELLEQGRDTEDSDEEIAPDEESPKELSKKLS